MPATTEWDEDLLLHRVLLAAGEWTLVIVYVASMIKCRRFLKSQGKKSLQFLWRFSPFGPNAILWNTVVLIIVLFPENPFAGLSPRSIFREATNARPADHGADLGKSQALTLTEKFGRSGSRMIHYQVNKEANNIKELGSTRSPKEQETERK